MIDESTTMKPLQQEKYEVPTILYDEPKPGERPNILPYIEVTQEGKMPPVIFIYEYKQTGEFEPDSNGEPVEIVDQIPHRYFDMEFLQAKLPSHLNDMVRVLLGMQPQKEAKKDGQAILDKVEVKIKEKKKKVTS